MILKFFIGFLVLIGFFLIYISTRPGHFHYEVTDEIKAPPEVVFLYLSDLQKGGEWSPYEQIDPKMKKEFHGKSNEVGGKLTFRGNADAGSGSLEIMKIVPNELVEFRLTMTAPLKAENIVQYRIKPTESGTQMTWAMSGDGGYIGKLVTFFIDCEKMVTDQFRKGIQNLQNLLENK